MNYLWRDYNPNTTGYVEAWLDESAIQSTGLDDGFRDFYEYWANEVDFVVGENFWCKVVFENDTPFAVIAVCRHEQKTNIMEVVIAPKKRGQGNGTKLLKDFLENAGFKHSHNNENQDGESMLYVYDGGVND